MKNNTKKTQPLVDVFSIDGKYKGVSRPVAYEGEKYILKENEVIFTSERTQTVRCRR